MKSLLTICVALILTMSLSSTSSGNTYASGLKISNPDSVSAFDGNFQDGTGVLLWYTLNEKADTVLIWVKSGSTVVRTLAADTARGKHAVEWDGKDDLGVIVPTGSYTFEVYASSGGNTTGTWKQVWQEDVYGDHSTTGLSSRDIDVADDPASGNFGFLYLTESTSFYGYNQMLKVRPDGKLETFFSVSAFPTAPQSDFDPWHIEYVTDNSFLVTSNTLGKLYVYEDTTRVDSFSVSSPRGVGVYSPATSDTGWAYVASGRILARILHVADAFVSIDTILVADTTGGVGYIKDVGVNDEGWLYVSFGSSSTSFPNIVKLSPSGVPVDTLVAPDRVTHVHIDHGSDRSTAADDVVYYRVRGANGGVFRFEEPAFTGTQLVQPSTSTSGSHSFAFDIVGNLYYANPSAEWVRMYSPPDGFNSYTTSSPPYLTIDVVTSVPGESAGLVPDEYYLQQNYPNPFNPSTIIEYGLPSSGRVRLTVYNVLGQEVAVLVDDDQVAGQHTAVFDASTLASGTYVYVLSAADRVVLKKKMLLVK